jgi:hypothetical protein
VTLVNAPEPASCKIKPYGKCTEKHRCHWSNALIVYLLIINQLAKERAARLERELLDAEAQIAQLESQRSLVEKQFTERTKSSRPSFSSRRKPLITASTELAAQSPVLFPPAENDAAYASRVAASRERTPGPWLGYTATAGNSSSNIVRIEGTSSIRDWQVEGHLIGGTAEFAAGFPLPSDLKPDPIDAKVNASVTVRSLKSVAADGRSYSDRMDEIMNDALQGQKHSGIKYTLTSLSQTQTSGETNAALVYEAVGQLALAGQTNTLTMPVSVIPFPDGRLVVRLHPAEDDRFQNHTTPAGFRRCYHKNR